MDELIRDLILIFAGWFLGVLTTSVDNWRKSRHEYRVLFGRCYRVIEKLAMDLAISEAWTEYGGIHSLTELFITSNSNKVRLPPTPPDLPDDFHDVLNRLFEYEATQPKSKLGKQFLTIEGRVQSLNFVYDGLKTSAEISDNELPEKALLMYKDTWSELREYLTPIIIELDYHRSPYIIRPFKVIRRKWKQLRKPKVKNVTASPKTG